MEEEAENLSEKRIEYMRRAQISLSALVMSEERGHSRDRGKLSEVEWIVLWFYPPEIWNHTDCLFFSPTKIYSDILTHRD